ncbi:hypothetical protein RCL_jg15251.t1 [Rhizophagus clarus]|uniref:Uncharacterized protein n=1 Tax=Rhizophagus clarus TaxID=94130 RepID=A0A8H3L332_9GLOM|nr:hypothetical protein RCL_jg15251.t1 [Rhizophagus clarus]
MLMFPHLHYNRWRTKVVVIVDLTLEPGPTTGSTTDVSGIPSSDVTFGAVAPESLPSAGVVATGSYRNFIILLKEKYWICINKN